MSDRVAQAEKHRGHLADCLMAWTRGGDGIDAYAGAVVVADVMIAIRRALVR